MNNHPLELLISQYLAEKDITKESFDLYQTILKQYISYLKDKHILYAKTSDVTDYISWKKTQGYSVRWIYHQISTVKGLYQYLSLNQKRLDLPELYAIDITEAMINERIKQKLSKPILNAQEAKQLILKTKEKRKYIWHYRDYAMIYLMITTGLRSIEMRRARKSDLSMINQEMILYIQGKGRTSSDEFVKLAPGVSDAITDYLKMRSDKNPYLFISHSMHTDIPYLSRTFFIKMFKRVLKDAGLDHKKITPHSLRHTAATFNLLRGGTLESTRQFMRHANMSSTLIYAHHTNRLTDDSPHQIESYILGESAHKKE